MNHDCGLTSRKLTWRDLNMPKTIFEGKTLVPAEVKGFVTG